MSINETLQIPLPEMLEKYRHYPLNLLYGNQDFARDLIGTGVNEGNYLSRRFKFVRPTLEILIGEPKARVEIWCHYGLGSKKCLYWIERHELITPAKNPVLHVENADDIMAVLEEQIQQYIGVPGYQLPEDLRYRKLKEFFSPDNPRGKYGFELNIGVDTLSVCGNLSFDVILNYMEIKDYIDQALEVMSSLISPDEIYQDKRHIYQLGLDEGETVPLYVSFIQHLLNQPNHAPHPVQDDPASTYTSSS